MTMVDLIPTIYFLFAAKIVHDHQSYIVMTRSPRDHIWHLALQGLNSLEARIHLHPDLSYERLNHVVAAGHGESCACGAAWL